MTCTQPDAWHFEKSTKLRKISRQLEFGSVPEKEASDRWNGVATDINEKAPTLENSPCSPQINSVFVTVGSSKKTIKEPV
jgi:L-rhamnose mutarotase